MLYSLEWKISPCHCPQHQTRFQNCSLIAPRLAPACLPYTSQAISGLLWKCMQKACLIRGSILQRAQGLDASKRALGCLQNDALWCCAPAKDVRVITTNALCTECNRIWTKVLCCKLAIFSSANCNQRLYKVWATDEHFLKSLEKKPPVPKRTQVAKQLWQKQGEWKWEIRFPRMTRHFPHEFWICVFQSVEIHCE